MVYGEAANGKAIEVSANDEFEISLPETRTAGFRWTAERMAGPTCRIVNETSDPATAGAGGSGAHRWRFKAVSAGTGEIEFHYARGWEQNKEPAKKFTLKVHVRP